VCNQIKYKFNGGLKAEHKTNNSLNTKLWLVLFFSKLSKMKTVEDAPFSFVKIKTNCCKMMFNSALNPQSPISKCDM
jgi:hypothetical protein